MSTPIKTYDCSNGGSQFCQGCYTMEAQEAGYGDWLAKSDVRERLAAMRQTSMGQMLGMLDALIQELDV